MAQKQIHIVPNGKRWEVKQSGNPTPLSTHNRKDTAVSAGRAVAKRREVELVIHGKDGAIQDKDSYGRDPCPPKDKVN